MKAFFKRGRIAVVFYSYSTYNFYVIIKSHFPFLVILVSAIFLVWHKVLSLSLTGEGYWYFVHPFEGGRQILRFDVGAEAIMSLLMPIFRDNIALYQAFLLVVWIIISVLFYFLVFEITNKRSIAFIASLFFGANFTTAYEMLAMGAYQNFLQRVLFVVFIFPSFIFFVKYNKTSKLRYFLLSLPFFTLGVFLAHFNTFFLPFIILYGMGLLIFTKNSRKKKIALLIHVALFVLIDLGIVYLAWLMSITSYVSGSFIQYLLNNTEFIINQSLRQLVYLTIPFHGFGGLLSSFEISIKESITNFYIPVLIIYILVFIYLFKIEVKYRIAIVTSLLFLPAIFALNLYMRSDNVQYLESGSRYLFVPSIGFALFWGIFFYSLSKIKILKVFVYLVLACWVYLQISSVSNEISKDYYKHMAINKSLHYIKSITPQFKDDSIIIVPSVVGPWGSAFSQKFYGRKNTEFIPMWGVVVVWNDVAKRPFDPKKDKIVHYDYKKEKVVDKTSRYQEVIILDTK